MWIGLNVFQINITIDSSIIKFNVSMRSYLLCTICNIVVFFFKLKFNSADSFYLRSDAPKIFRRYYCTNSVWIEYLKNHKLQHCQLNSTKFITVHFTNPQQIHQFWTSTTTTTNELQLCTSFDWCPKITDYRQYEWNSISIKWTTTLAHNVNEKRRSKWNENREKANTSMSITTKIICVIFSDVKIWNIFLYESKPSSQV